LRLAERPPLFEIARVLVRFYHVASVIVNANHGIVPESVSFCVQMKS
jgi:hypothetical protein